VSDSAEPQLHPMPEGTFPPPPVRYTLRISEITSVIIMSFRKVRTMTGSPEEIEAFYRRVNTHNLLLGWWGFPFGIIWTPMVLSKNHKALEKFRGLVKTGMAPAAWLPDPTGRHGARYWDGQQWSDRVSDVATDPVPGNT
jgi:hypothetical protein